MPVNVSYVGRSDFRGELYFVPSNPAASADEERIELLSWSPNSVQVRASISRPGRLVLNRNWADGWKAQDPYKNRPKSRGGAGNSIMFVEDFALAIKRVRMIASQILEPCLAPTACSRKTTCQRRLPAGRIHEPRSGRGSRAWSSRKCHPVSRFASSIVPGISAYMASGKRAAGASIFKLCAMGNGKIPIRKSMGGQLPDRIRRDQSSSCPSQARLEGTLTSPGRH